MKFSLRRECSGRSVVTNGKRPGKTADNLRSRHYFSHETTSEKRGQKITQVQVALEQVLWLSSYLKELSSREHCMGLAENI